MEVGGGNTKSDSGYSRPSQASCINKKTPCSPRWDLVQMLFDSLLPFQADSPPVHSHRSLCLYQHPNAALIMDPAQ